QFFKLPFALAEKLKQWNTKPGFFQRLAGNAPRTQYKILPEDWTVEFYPDVEGKLQRGDIEIYSELGAASKPEYGVGAMTQRITKREASGRQSTREQAAPAAAGSAYARIRYDDDSGTHEFAVTTNQVVIGRGGKAYWVDLKLDTATDVSREHCRLRRDPVSGRFYVKDVSQFGTTVNGKAVPSSVETVNGEQKDTNVETPLPEKARIVLAGVVSLDFEQEAR
ncbi:MAG: FHA domain-containing protein, partial [Acidobacteria bacterium]|nr:FHA domain-containing protein [Acidobacteriota bacterium]